MGNLQICEKPVPVNALPETVLENVPKTFVKQTNPKTGDFESRILRMHNNARKINGLQPLVWDNSLQTKAADWLQFLKEKDNGSLTCSSMRHPGTEEDGTEAEVGEFLPGGNGQNLYQASGSSYINYKFTPFDPSSPEDAVQQWYNECSIFNELDPETYKGNNTVPDRFMEIGHMTQMLWKNATKIGCSSSGCTDKVKGADGKLRDTMGQIINCHYDKGNVAGQFYDQLPLDIKCGVNLI